MAYKRWQRTQALEDLLPAKLAKGRQGRCGEGKECGIDASYEKLDGRERGSCSAEAESYKSRTSDSGCRSFAKIGAHVQVHIDEGLNTADASAVARSREQYLSTRRNGM
uniref:Uncharacterized protein n=1 Tax=Haemonchus contortus TaxID=6289 RepID=A0A7I4XYJ8_HAECO